MIRGYRVWDNQEKTYSDKAFSIDQLGICYVQDEDGYWEEIDDSRFIVEFETGLTDKNGKEICEGDIVRYKLYADSRLDYIDEVFYSTISGAFMVGDEDNIRTLDWLINVEVIGNIHEPPKDFRPEHLKRMGVSISKGGGE